MQRRPGVSSEPRSADLSLLPTRVPGRGRYTHHADRRGQAPLGPTGPDPAVRAAPRPGGARLRAPALGCLTCGNEGPKLATRNFLREATGADSSDDSLLFAGWLSGADPGSPVGRGTCVSPPRVHSAR